MTPVEAKQTNNHVEVWLYINSKATYDRKFPPLSIGSQVRTYVKPTSMKKGNVSVWSKYIFNITFIKDNEYRINDHRRGVWNRWELLKIDGAEGKDD